MVIEKGSRLMHRLASLRVSTGQESSKGVKPSNEDSMGLYVPTDPRMLTHKGAAAIIADGVSAAEAGQEAAETCVKSFLGDYFSTPDTWTVETSAGKVLTALNRWLHGQNAQFRDSSRGYVSTLSALVIKSRTAYVFHVGDTRVYLYRHGVLEQLTQDHALAISKQDTYLARAMGLDSNVQVDFLCRQLEVGDIFLLTSDGVHDSLTAGELVQHLERTRDLQDTCQELIEAALEAGSQDNLTCQLVRVDALPDASADEYLKRLTELPFAPDLSPGTKLDGFEVISELHASRRSQLYLVRDLRSGTLLAMKTPSVNYEDDPAYIERFVLEQWIGTRVKNRHLVKSIEPPQDRSCLYNLIEYVEGETIAEWIEKRAGTVPKQLTPVIDLIGQFARGLQALHRKEILHQDLKPANLMISKHGIGKIIDYGSCFVAGVDEITAPIVRDKILGTASYAAPEYSIGLKARRASDLYSLGCIAYEMLTGKHPYGEAADEARSLVEFEKLEYTPAYRYNPHIPLWIDGALRKAVQVDPAERYQELSDFVYDLENPNPDFLEATALPLMTRDRTSFWRATALTLLVTQLLTLLYFLGAAAN